MNFADSALIKSSMPSMFAPGLACLTTLKPAVSAIKVKSSPVLVKKLG